MIKMSFVSALAAAISITSMGVGTAHGQTLSDGQDATGTALDCRSSNRLFPVVGRTAQNTVSVTATSEAGLEERSRTGSTVGTVYGQIPGELGFGVGFFVPANTFNNSPNGVSGGAAGNAFIPLCAVALTSEVSALNARLDALGGDATGRLAAVELSVRDVARASALAGALDMAMPIAGASNRVGLTINEGYREEAIGLSYVRVQGSFDIGVAVGYAGGDSSGKARVGFSW